MSDEFVELSDRKTKSADVDHLRILSILHYVSAGLMAVGGLSGLVIAGIGIAMANGSFVPPDTNDPAAAQAFGVILTVIGFVALILNTALAAAIGFVGYCLSRTRAYLFCVIVAAFECLNFPLGTLLGIFTIVVLMRDSVKARFAAASDSP